MEIRDNCLSGPKFCPTCGKQLGQSAPICGYCGTNFSKRKVMVRKNKRSKKITKE
ncbi:MAG: zinc-ribbon domain-containing protein [Promethearchaeota archaeon]